jgi:hypothetical protein
MLTESARAASAAEQRYRISDPNSKPRKVKVVALDASAAELVDRISQRNWSNATFLTALPVNGSGTSTRSDSLKQWMLDVIGKTEGLVDKIRGIDLVVLVTSAAGQIDAAIPIGEACAVLGVPVVGLVMRDRSDFDDASRQPIKTLRSITTMLVIATAEDYVEEMLVALRA